MSESILRVAQGEFQILRFPLEKNQNLRAWDAADEYLLNDVAPKLAVVNKPRVLIINDAFGALAVALNNINPCCISDSFISQMATLKNLSLNQIAEHQIRLFDSLSLPKEQFDFVLIKAPKTLAFLEDMLLRLQSALIADTQVIIAGMVKNMSPAIWQMLCRLIGATVPSKAVKKARLIYATPDAQRSIPANPYPVCYRLEKTKLLICNHANVFSHQNLDIGTRFFLDHLPQDDKYKRVVDLGCGNGVVGLIFATYHPNAYIEFVDESFMAVASARMNFQNAFADRQANFKVSDTLTEFQPNSADLILCNPPFHQQNAIGTHIAQRMFKQAKKVLHRGGELWVIGNRHLDYHVNLKKYFSRVELVASNTKFIILKASSWPVK